MVDNINLIIQLAHQTIKLKKLVYCDGMDCRNLRSFGFFFRGKGK